ncbi:hypothetical protein BJY52DRAFT_1216208 [Lactarius psammicola]|nr:hypothetical protein BJY52DRAFT_1216208 [Lactarius psammicola]
MVMWFNAPIWGVSWSPNGRFIAAAGSKTIEIRDTLIGSSVVSIDLPKPLLYVSSYIDEVYVGHRLKVLVQTPAIPVEGRTAGSRVVEALKRAEDIASLVPVLGLKNVFGSLVALIHAAYRYEDGPPIKEKDLSDVPNQVINDLEEFARTIEAITADCRQKLSQGRLERFTMEPGDVIQEAPDPCSYVSDAIYQFMERETVQLLNNTVDVERRIEPVVFQETNNPDMPTYYVHHGAECLKGTRTVVLDEIFAWLKDPSGARIFWLSGIAGSGKSAISRSVSIRAALLADHIVVSVFFSQFGYVGLCDPSSVFQTLAFQFSLLDTGYRERVSEVINEHPDIFEKDLQFQYEKLIVETVGAICRPHSCILITLDGIDECEPHGATAVLKVLLAEDVGHPKELKILAVGRPEAHLCKTFDAQRDIRKLSLEDVETEGDIRHYLRTLFEQLPTHFVNPFTVSEGTISKLAKRAGDSFIYAETMARFIFERQCQDPQSRVDFLLSNTADLEEHPYGPLDSLFLGILQQVLPLGASDDEKRRLRTVLGLLVCFREPFPIHKMESFCGLISGDIRTALHPLRSLVHVPYHDHEAPRIYNRSFTDFIVDPARCLDRNFVVDIGSTEQHIFNKCYSLYNQKMPDSDGPRANDSSADVCTTTPPTDPVCRKQVQYAFLYWVSHLTKVKDVDENTLHHLDDRCLLRWIEFMAALGMLREAVTHIDQVRTWMTSLRGLADEASDRLVDLMDNAFRLLLHRTTAISYDSLLIYGSAFFTSVDCPPPVLEVKRSNDNQPLEPVEHADSVSLMPLFKLYYDSLQVFAWSPSSQYIAVSRVNGIEIWDTQLGSIVDSFDLLPSLEHVLDPKKVSCQCLAYYPDNSRIAYITRDGRVQVRNTLARTEEFVVTGHKGGLVSVNVSPNGKFLASASNSGRIQVCNAENGDLVWAIETGTMLKSMSISPNSRFLVSLSYTRNHGVQIWNAIDGLPLGVLPHDRDIISVSLSPDSNQLASVDEEGLVRVWGTSQMTTEPIQEWSIGALPTRLFFSPNGRQLAAATDDSVHILCRDADYAAILDGHTGPVTSLAFSADGSTLASGSLDGTIRVWDTPSVGIGSLGVVKHNLKQTDWHDVTWSPRGRIVMASNFRESKVWIWSTQDGTSRVLEDCSDGFPVAISDCGQYVATHSSSRNTETIATRRIASDVVQSNSLSFSLGAPDSHRHTFFPNSTRFAATSGKEILTWDASVAHPEVTRLVGHSEKLYDLHFVPDGSRLLSRAGEEVFAWSVDTLQLVSRTGNVIPRYHTPRFEATEDNWVTMILPDDGRRRLFRLPSEYQPYWLSSWSITASWLSKCILIRGRNGNVFVVDFSALPAAMIDYTM